MTIALGIKNYLVGVHVFFFYNQVEKKIIWYFNKYKILFFKSGWRVWETPTPSE